MRPGAEEAEHDKLPANQGSHSLLAEKLAVDVSVWSVATMGVVACLLLVLLFGTRVHQNAGKCLFTVNC